MNNADICYSKCNHKEVCALKSDFEKAQKAVDECSVSLGKTKNGYATKYLRDFVFIEHVELHCKHFAKGGIVFRGDDDISP